MSTPIRLISFAACPYVQRSVIALRHKGVAYDIDFIDLQNKPAWFLALNPRGKVPVVVVEDEVVYESAIINEMLDELYPVPPMMPTSPIRRAQARIWLEWCNSAVMPAMTRIMFGKTEADEREGAEELHAALQRIEAELQTRPGPFFDGEQFGLVDATWAPAFDRLVLLEQQWGWQRDASLTRVWAWAERLLAHPAVRGSRPENLAELYVPYRTRQLAARQGA